MKTLTIKDFSGGLNTAKAPELLTANQTPSLRNVELLRSGAIKSRYGYASILATPLTAPVDALYRHYESTGGKIWVAVTGTHITANTSDPSKWTRAEVENLSVTGTYSMTYKPTYSGGSALTASTTLSFTTPTCTQFRLSCATASVRVDSGAWESVTSQTYQSVAASSATHTVDVKLGDSGAANISFGGGSLDPGEYGTEMTVWFDLIRSGVSVWTGGSFPALQPVQSGDTLRLTCEQNGIEASADLVTFAAGLWTGGAISGSVNIHSYDEGLYCTYDWTGGYVTAEASEVYVDYLDYIDASSWSEPGMSISASATDVGFASYLDRVYVSTAYDTLAYLENLATPTAIASGPKGGFMVAYKDRLWIAGDSDDSAMVRWSAVADPGSWVAGVNASSPGAAWAMAIKSGQETTGLKVMNDTLFQFTNAGVYTHALADNDSANYASKTLSNQYGCIAPKSIGVAPNTLIWLGSDAIYTYGVLSGVNPLEGGSFGRISDDIEPTIRGIADKTKPIGTIYNGSYWLACDPENRGYNSTVLVYRFPAQDKAGAWTRYDYANLKITSLFTTRGDEYGLYAGTYGGDIVQLDTGYNDGGSRIDWFYTMPPLAPSSTATVKHFRVMHVAAASDATQSVSITFETDDVAPPTQVIQASASTGLKPYRVLIPARGRYIAPKFSSSSSNQDTSIESITVSYIETPIR